MVTLADERLDEDLLCQILEGSHPALLQDDGSAEQRRRCSSSRSRSRGVGRSTITAATTAQPLAWQGAELNPADWEEEEMVKQLNVIESGPLEEEQWQRICENGEAQAAAEEAAAGAAGSQLQLQWSSCLYWRCCQRLAARP